MATTTKMAAAQEASEAEQHWLEAKKITHSMVKKLEQIDKDESGSKKLLAELESVEHLLESLRLACMATTFTDFKFAHKNRVLDRLWHVHTLISAEYKKGLQRHRGHGHIVQFRTIEKQYAKHLKTAQYFYKGFIERLSARYRLRSLQRVAHTMQSGDLKISDVIDADEARLSHELTVACYRTVLHMGDIARYRLNASRQKGHNPDVAMTYYALAQDLMPQEGDAHHQMAVVLAEQRRDFDVVYHFLRSWSVQQPFALAPKNLASEFKKLLQPPSTSRKQGNTPPDAYEMFGSWFVRLHANYFKGEEFSSQGELEREVLHRWEALIKKAEQPAYLQKAVLMNIAAYDIALKKVQDEWTATSSQSCQFILQFMVRTILVLSRVLETDTQRLFEEPASEEEVVPASTPAPVKKATSVPAANEKNEMNEKSSRANGRNRATAGNNNNIYKAPATDNSNKQGGKKNVASDTCLSLFRVCMAWIATHNEDLVKFEEYLAPYIADMHRSITRCLTLFVELIATTEASPTTYLLPEDVEVIGLAPLDGWTALREGDDANSPFKPHFNEEGIERKSAAYETLARIYDIVECTVRLIGDPSFPWILESVQEEGREVTKISYSEDRTSSSLASVPMVSLPPTAPVVSASYAAASAATVAASQTLAIIRPTQSSSSSREARQLAQRHPEAAPVVPAQTTPVVVAPIGQPIGGPSSTARETVSRPMPAPRSMSYKDMDDDDFLPGSMKEPPLMPVNSNSLTGYKAPAVATDPELDFLESAAYSRVANFLSPPELHPHLPQATPLQQPSLSSPLSYGIHTSTSENVFGQLQTPSVSGVSNPSSAAAATATAKPIPSSPWGGSSYIHSLGYYPQQQQQTAYGMGGMGSGGSMGNIERQPANIEDQLAYLTLVKQQERQLAAAQAASAAAPISPSSYGLDSLSRGFPSALSPVGTTKQQQQPHSPSGVNNGVGTPGGFTNLWVTGGGSGGGGGHLNGSRLLPQQLQQAQAASLSIGAAAGMGMGMGGPASSPAMLYSSNFSMNNSMPSVQSPRSGGGGGGGGGFFDNTYESIYGSPAGGGGNRYQMQQQQQLQQLHNLQQQRNQQQQQLGAFGGYGDYNVAGGQINGPVNGNGNGAIGTPIDGVTSSNAVWQDAATAWGRGMPLTKDDPTHFRNAVRQSGLMDDTNAYDRNALLSALDDKNSPAQQR